MGVYIVLGIVALFIIWAVLYYCIVLQTDPFGRSCANCGWITHPQYPGLKKVHPTWCFLQLDVELIGMDGRITVPHLFRGPAENKTEQHLRYSVEGAEILFFPRDAVDPIIKPWKNAGYILVFPEP
jgi:hypothetical protein